MKSTLSSLCVLCTKLLTWTGLPCEKTGFSRAIIRAAVRKRDRVAEGAPLLREYGV
jgi:hypothetical protein